MKRLLFAAGAGAWWAAALAGSLAAEATPQGPEVAEAGGRAHIVLNGVWPFCPAEGREPGPRPGATEWGLIRVPGSWWPQRMRDAGVVESRPEWKIGEGTNAAWYRRQVEVPAGWAGRQILLDLERVSTEAKVWVDGREAGQTSWPGGILDITKLVTPGRSATLEIFVTARAQGTEFEFMGIGQDTVQQARLRQRGLIGDVFLRALPAGARVAGVFIQPSVRKKELVVDVELENLPPGSAGEVAITARAEPEGGGEAMEFSSVRAELRPGEDGLFVARAAWPWENPKLWDWKQPHLYTLNLQVKGAGVDDTFRERFGFREFWIEGRKVLFNGTEFRPRPANITDGNGHRAAVDASVALALDRGIGLAWMWPENYQGRGRPFWQKFLADAADRQGLPLLGNLVRLNEYMRDAKFRDTWEAGREPWTAAVRREWRKFRNHPSIVGWVLSGNVGPRHQDQNPRRIGRRDWAPDPTLKGLSEAREIMAKLDPGRCVLFGAAAYEGDIYSAMTYLNFIPLQERAEWLSDWAENGEMPYLAIEFGTPLHSSYMRGRMGFRPSGETEPWVAEFAAIYLGPEAYRLESERYRRQIRSKYQAGEKFSSFNFDEAMESDPAFQAIQELFIRETYRAWRAWNAGWVGMVAWHSPQFFLPNARTPDVEVARQFKPGELGAWPEKIPGPEMARSWRGPEFRELPAGRALLMAEAPTMAFLAGGPQETTDKTRNYVEGQVVQKQLVLVNDTRQPQPFSATWKTVGLGQEATRSESGELKPGESRALPVEFFAPAAVTPPGPLRAKIELEALIGEAQHQDALEFDVFPKAFQPAFRGPVALWDPAGKTRSWLDKLGITSAPWKGQKAQVVVVGREALSGGHEPPASLEEFVQNGGRLLIMIQQPEWLRTRLGLRVARHTLRQVWPLQNSHPVMKGLEPVHVSYWAGASTLLDPKPAYPNDKFPEFGWRWGQRHAVSAGAIEKPHLAGWRPILEGGFDLQYSPLLELDYGRGRAILCTLDLEDAADPAASRLGANILAYAATAPLRPRASRTIYVGGEAGEKFVRSLGLLFESRPALEPNAQLAVVAPDATVAPASIDNFLRRGGRILFLAAPKGGEKHFGAPVALKKNFRGSLEVPALPETEGLSVSELRYKTDADARLLGAAEGLEVLAEGLLAVRRLGEGVAVYCQLDPAALDADQKQYFRFTRWRHTRAIVQLLANLGAVFEADSRVFRPHIERISLAGEWKVRFTKELPPVSWENKHLDPGISDAARSLAAAQADETGFETFALPAMHPRFDEICGEAVWRKTIDLPADWAGQMVSIQIPAIKSYDTVFWNGTPVGSTSKDTQKEDPWNLPRRYRVPAHLVKAGPNVIAIRQFAPDTNAGVHGREEEFFVRLLASRQAPPALYHPDYREKFDTGDEPARYYRW